MGLIVGLLTGMYVYAMSTVRSEKRILSLSSKVSTDHPGDKQKCRCQVEHP